MFRAEVLGLVTTTATKVAAAVAVLGLVLAQLVFVTLLPALARGDIGPGAAALGDDLPVIDLTSPAAQLDALSPLGTTAGGGSIGLALIAIVLLGVLAGTSDDRHGGIVGAVLASPRRSRIVIAKAAALATGSAAIGLVLAVVSVLTLAGALAITGLPFTAAGTDVAATAVRGIFAVACLALMGLAVGIICKSQLAGVLIMIGILVTEPVLLALSALIGRGTPGTWTQFLPVTLAQHVIHGTSAVGGVGVAIGALAALTIALLSAAAVVLGRRNV